MSIKGYMIPEFTDNIFGKTAELGTRHINQKKSRFLKNFYNYICI